TQDDYATVSVAARVTLGADGAIAEARVALGAAATVPVRATAVEAELVGKTSGEATFRDVAPLVVRSIDPIADFRGSAEYKRKMAVVHVGRALTQAASRASKPADNR